MNKVVLVALAFGLVYGMFSYMALSYNDAMNKCQETHSFDTCFYSLNR